MLNKKLAAIVAVAVMAIALFAIHHTSVPEPTASSRPVVDEHGPVQVATREPPRALQRTSGLVSAELGTPGLDRDDPVTAYRKANIYPPGSRPLTRDHVDLLKPGQRYEQWRPMDADDGTMFLFTADRYFAFGADVVTSTLSVKNAATIHITQALLATTDPAQKPIAMTYTQQGNTWVAQIAPSTLKLAQQTELGFYIEFDDGTAKQRTHFNVQYTPDGGVPARFTGVFADAVIAGSLVIRAGMQVNDAGHYVLDCNLYDAADNPVGWVHWKGDLATGAQNADLQFFGKVIVDAGAKGPFHIGQLRGARFDPGHQPDLSQIPPYDGAYATAAYATTEFSGDEYDSADKQKMLQFLSQQQAAGVHQAGATMPAGKPPAPGDDH